MGCTALVGLSNWCYKVLGKFGYQAYQGLELRVNLDLVTMASWHEHIEGSQLAFFVLL